MPQKELQKNFSGEFNKLLNKLKKGENFAFSRFSDGELFMLQGKKVVLAKDHYITGDEKGHGIYPEEEQKNFDPEEHEFHRDRLIDAFQFRKKNYFKGVSGKVDVGEKDFKWQLNLYGHGDREHLTFSNVFINNNYPRFLNEFVPLLKKRPIIFVVNKKADLSKLLFNDFDIVKDFRIGSNCIVNDYHLVEEIKSYIKDNNIKDHVILCSASALSNYIVHQCYDDCNKNTYIDIGISLSPWLGLDGWKYSRAYLQHWVLGMENQYGTKVDVW